MKPDTNPASTSGASQAGQPTAFPLAAGSALMAAYERRKKHAEESLDFWMAEFAARGDGCARVQMDRAHSTLGDINEQLHKLRKPGCVVYEPTQR